MASQKMEKAQQVEELSAANTPMAFPFVDLPQWGAGFAKDLSLGALCPKVGLVPSFEGWKELSGIDALAMLPLPGFEGATPAKGAGDLRSCAETSIVASPAHQPIARKRADGQGPARGSHSAVLEHTQSSADESHSTICLGLGPLHRVAEKDGTVWLSGGTRWAKAMQRSKSDESLQSRVIPAAEKNLLVRAKSKLSVQSNFSAASTISGSESDADRRDGRAHASVSCTEETADSNEGHEAQDQSYSSRPVEFKRPRSGSVSSSRSMSDMISLAKSNWSVSSKFRSPFSKRTGTSVKSA